ncbi:MAG: four helix bundle protein [bacterium]
MKKDNLIQEKSFEFALLIIELYKKLIASNEFVISKQLLRSATSMGANIESIINILTKIVKTSSKSI